MVHRAKSRNSQPQRVMEFTYTRHKKAARPRDQYHRNSPMWKRTQPWGSRRGHGQ